MRRSRQPGCLLRIVAKEQCGLALNGGPRTRVGGSAAGGIGGPGLRFRSRGLVQFDGFAAGEILGKAAGGFVAVLIEGDEEFTIAASELLVKRADDAAADAFGFAA